MRDSRAGTLNARQSPTAACSSTPVARSAASAAESVSPAPTKVVSKRSNFSPVTAPCGDASTLSRNWSGKGMLVTRTKRAPCLLAVAANKHGARYVLVTSIPLPDQFLDNVLASPQGAITGEKFERFETTFVGAGDTLSAALAALLATGVELHAAVGEALAFLDQALDAGFRPGMGNVVPDRFFWALPAEGDEEGDGGGDDVAAGESETAPK